MREGYDYDARGVRFWSRVCDKNGGFGSSIEQLVHFSPTVLIHPSFPFVIKTI